MKNLLLTSTLLLSTATNIQSNTLAMSSSSIKTVPGNSNDYTVIPSEYNLDFVMVFHRHGDRAQISRTLGSNYPESDDIAKIWKTLLPSNETNKAMLLTANPSDATVTTTGDMVDIEKSLYTGWDNMNVPYAQLTELGSQQLIEVGSQIRQRYTDYSSEWMPSSIKDAKTLLQLRSTNMCRTLQSLRSFLAGYFNVNNSAINYINKDKQYNNPDTNIILENSNERTVPVTVSDLADLPTISTRLRAEENLYPQASGACPAMAERRKVVLPPDLVSKTISNYDEVELRMKELLGFPDTVNWLTVKEVLTCHAVHNIDVIKGVTDKDLDKATEITGWMWGVLFNDDTMNRLAIGRFLNDLLHDINSVINNDSSKRMLIYSGHDSTLVPLLCALGIYDDIWPYYAAHLELEFVTHKDNGGRFVRAIYNHKPVVIPLHTTLKQRGNSTYSIESKEDKEWSSLDDFQNRLQDLAISNEDYHTECNVVVTNVLDNKNKHDKEIEDEIRATIDGFAAPTEKSKQ